MQETIVKSFWMQFLPQKIQAILAILSTVDDNTEEDNIASIQDNNTVGVSQTSSES